MEGATAYENGVEKLTGRTLRGWNENAECGDDNGDSVEIRSGINAELPRQILPFQILVSHVIFIILGVGSQIGATVKRKAFWSFPQGFSCIMTVLR